MQSNSAQDIGEATRALLSGIAERNGLHSSEVVSVFFSVTRDLTAMFPASAAREVGWDAPMLDMCEMDVTGALARCLRVLVHVDRDGEVQHVYLRGARSLRPDLEERK